MTEQNAARRLPVDKLLAGAAFILGLLTILGAWASQLIGGLVPCELCWGQRVPYYWGLPILATILILWNRLPLTVWYIAMAAVLAIFAWSVYLGGYHAGVEWGFWPGPASCSGIGSGDLSFDSLLSGDLEPVISCDTVQFRDPVLQFSLAGWNAIISAAIVLMIGAAMLVQARRRA